MKITPFSPAIFAGTLVTALCPPTYELFWATANNPCSISSRDKDRLVRQMHSLAARRIGASLYQDGYPIGYVGPGPKSRSGAGFDVVIFGRPVKQN